LTIGKKIRSNTLSPSHIFSIYEQYGLGCSALAYRLFSHPVDRVIERKHGVTIEHAGACVSHDVPYFFSHIGLITMYTAISAGGFSFLKRALVKPPSGVIQKRSAVAAEGITGFMPAATIDTYHRFNGFFLSQHSAVLFRHS